MTVRTGSGRRGSWLADRPISVKLGLVVVVLAGAAVGCGAVGVLQLNALNGDTHAIYANEVQLQQVSTAMKYTVGVRADLRDHLLTTSAAGMATFAAAVQEDDRQIAAALADFERGGVDSVEKQDLAGFRDSFAAYAKIRDSQVLAASTAGRKDEAYQVLGQQAVPTYKVALTYLDHLLSHQTTQSKASMAASSRRYNQALWYVIAGLVVGLICGIGLASVMVRLIVRPVGEVADLLDRMADGDLTCRIEDPARDEVGRMAASASRAADSMSGALTEMSRGADELTIAAQQLDTAAGQVAESAARTSERAGAVSSVAEQISTNVQTVAAGAEEMDLSIREIAANATAAARAGEEAIGAAEVTSAKVGRLGEVSTEVTRVVELIGAIARQTGLLSLNATIEAARAGELGKGFAVVASEVKGLSHQTAGASDDVTRRITAMQAETASMVTAIDSISEIISRLGETQTSIAGAVEQQSRTTTEISANVNQVAAGAIEIATTIAGVAEAAAGTSVAIAGAQQAAVGLSTLSSRLREQVSGFRLAGQPDPEQHAPSRLGV